MKNWRSKNMFKKKLIVLFLFSVICVSAFAQQMSESELKGKATEYAEKGIAEYNKGNYQQAAQYYSLSIQHWGSPMMYANLCELYLYGKGVEMNYENAFQLCEVASKYGNINATVLMGEIYLKGKGVPVNKAKARPFYEVAAKAGHSQGQYILGMLMAEENTEGSLERAKYWLNKAIENGHPTAEKWLRSLEQRANKSN
jgi:uncharacterized protein